MRDLQHARGGASGNYDRGHYYDRGGKCGGVEERGRERDRYTKRARNRNLQCNADSAIETGIVAATETGRDRGSHRATRTTEIEAVSVAETATGIETGIVAATETDSTC